MGSCNIFHLPDEILENIFSYLNKDDILTSSLVCKHWLNILDHPTFLKDIYVKVECENINEIQSKQIKFSRKFANFIYVTFLNKQHLQFLEEYGEHIRLLEFQNSEIEENLNTESFYSQIFCKNLSVLKFQFGFFSLFQSLPNLKELYITYQAGYDICDSDIFKYRNTMLNLEKLVLIHPVATRDVVIKRFYPGEIKWSDRPSKQILTFPAVSDFIEKRTRTLSSLDINCDLQAKAALKLSQTKNLRLKRFSLRFCYECINVLPEICKNQNSLVDLDLSGLFVKDDIITSICTTLPLLESFILEGNSVIDISIENIFQLKHLNILDLSDCCSIKTESLLHAINVFQLNNLTKLSLNLTKFEDRTLRSLLKLTSSLRYLSLNSCPNVSDETIHDISKNLVSLQYLSLAGNSKISDEGIVCLQDPEKSLSHIKGLKELNLTSCIKITYHGLLKGIKFLELHTLKITLYHLTQIDTIQERLKEHNPTLKITGRIYVVVRASSPNNHIDLIDQYEEKVI